MSNVKIDAFNIRLLNVNSKDMNDHQASSASEVTFLNEANKLRNTTLGCVKEASVNENEFVAAENKDKLDVLLNGPAKIRKKSYKKSNNQNKPENFVDEHLDKNCDWPVFWGLKGVVAL